MGKKLPPKDVLSFDWEIIYAKQGAWTLRAKVVGGWLIKQKDHYVETYPDLMSLAFVPDPDHAWKVKNIIVDRGEHDEH